jgi:hypothetical protein
MGHSTDGILAYGYDLGGEDEGWKIKETGEYGELETSWAEKIDDDHDIAEVIIATLLAANGFTETDPEKDGYYSRRNAAEAALNVEVVTYCSDTYPMLILAAHSEVASRGEVIDVGELMREPTAEAAETMTEWNAALAHALSVLGITPDQTGPSWLLCSCADGMPS